VEILPNIPEAKLKVEEIDLKLNPPTLEPTSEPVPVTEVEPTQEPVIEKRVVVDISDQQAFLYENNELVNEFIISTGEPGRDTAIGEFEIQSKIPMAYASTWNLDMPFWLGIYWSGPLENGFHAVPTVRDTGVTMWDGYLGQRVSYGCIILSMEDAETLYNWVEMGTPVSIVP
jgi:lipoprotein-anchoring transpeptidase ErfK/SrfK